MLLLYFHLISFTWHIYFVMYKNALYKRLLWFLFLFDFIFLEPRETLHLVIWHSFLSKVTYKLASEVRSPSQGRTDIFFKWGCWALRNHWVKELPGSVPLQTAVDMRDCKPGWEYSGRKVLLNWLLCRWVSKLWALRGQPPSAIHISARLCGDNQCTSQVYADAMLYGRFVWEDKLRRWCSSIQAGMRNKQQYLLRQWTHVEERTEELGVICIAIYFRHCFKR